MPPRNRFTQSLQGKLWPKKPRNGRYANGQIPCCVAGEIWPFAYLPLRGFFEKLPANQHPANLRGTGADLIKLGVP